MLVRKTIPAPQKPKLRKPKNKVLPNNGAFSSELKNIQLCNGADRSTPEPQIKGCTALIEPGKETSLVLAVALPIVAMLILRKVITISRLAITTRRSN